MSTELSCFKAYDIRGRVPAELNLELTRQIGLAFAAEFSPSTVCIGRDARLSSRDFSLVLANGLEDGGAQVVDIGLCGTEEVYHATFSQGFDGGIMITASHNPADWNGMKLVRAQAAPVSADSGLLALKDRILAADLPLARKRGNTRRQSFREQYTRQILDCLGADAVRRLAPLTIVANAGNGCAWLPLREMVPLLPSTLIPLYETPDGAFPNGVPNPLLPENRRATSEAVLRHKADFGIAFDGDFDRCFFFDEQGGFIEGYYLVGLIAQALLREHPGEKIIHDSRLVWNTREMVLDAGGIPIESKAGHAFMKERMRAENALYGGEMSAHHYFRDFAHCDSGMLAWLLLYSLISDSGKPLSALVKERMRRYPVSGEINRSVRNAERILERIRSRYEKTARSVTFVDGLSMDMGDWRFNLRLSNTEPLLRLNVESREDPSLMEARRDELLTLMQSFA
jgi:phosphomannomutase